MTAQREQLYRQAALHLQQHVQMYVESNTAQLESPLEELLLESILTWLLVCGRSFTGDHNKTADYHLDLQSPIGRYRADVVITDLERNLKCAVEADGHTYHERTKEQAAYDRARDREMQALGYIVLRFTGSEIHHDPWACADSIFKAMWRAADVRDGVPIKPEEHLPKPILPKKRSSMEVAKALEAEWEQRKNIALSRKKKKHWSEPQPASPELRAIAMRLPGATPR